MVKCRSNPAEDIFETENLSFLLIIFYIWNILPMTALSVLFAGLTLAVASSMGATVSSSTSSSAASSSFFFLSDGGKCGQSARAAFVLCSFSFFTRMTRH